MDRLRCSTPMPPCRGHHDGHPGLGHGVHGAGDQGNLQDDPLGQVRRGGHLAGHHVGLRRQEQYIVEVEYASGSAWVGSQDAVAVVPDRLGQLPARGAADADGFVVCGNLVEDVGHAARRRHRDAHVTAGAAAPPVPMTRHAARAPFFARCGRTPTARWRYGRCVHDEALDPGSRRRPRRPVHDLEESDGPIEPLSADERTDVEEDLADLEAPTRLSGALVGIRGLVIDCEDCREPHFFDWALLWANLRHLLDSGRPESTQEPAFRSGPDHYGDLGVRPGLHGVHDTLVDEEEK